MDDMNMDTGKKPGKFVRTVSDYFLRLSIAKKMFVGYAFLVALLIIISIFVLTNLNNLNSINRSILEVDVPVIAASKSMTDSLLSQESYIRRYAILKTPDLLKAFKERSAEFRDSLDVIRSAPEERGFPVTELDELHRAYDSFLLKEYNKMGSKNKKTLDLFNKELKSQQDKIIGLLKDVESNAIRDQDEKVASTAIIGNTAFQVAALICLFGFIISIAAAVFVTFNISHAVNRLKDATERIAEGDFDYIPSIQNNDEVGDLSKAFVSMAGRLKKLEEMYIDASPLTRMPGGVAIENIMKKRIETKDLIAFCLMDLDNFKAYNDHYGYAKGNDLIIATSDIIEKSVEMLGDNGDFVGHIGGDDFVVITNPEKCRDICGKVVEDFDKIAPSFYNEEDRERGYILGEDRHGNERMFPLATISIAIVTNANRHIENHIQFGEIAAELKEYAKSITGSVYVVDHRRKEERSAISQEKVTDSKVVRLNGKKRKKKINEEG